MGNSSSKASPSASFKAQSRAEDGHRSSRTRRRPNSHSFSFTSTLDVPRSSSHRRSRSVNATANSGLLAPPPPYSAAIDTPSSVPLATTSTTSSAAARSSRTAAYLRAPMRQESVENALETLRKYDTVIIVDDSSSMKGRRWEDVRSLTLRLCHRTHLASLSPRQEMRCLLWQM
jgi:hypothetical protein